MTWYEITFLIAAILTVAQVVTSFIFGDVDFDVEGDFDFGDIFSFKGLIHFVLGSTITLIAFGENLYSYIGAIFVGVLFSYGLYKIYHFLYDKLQQELIYDLIIDTQDGEVYYWDNDSQVGQVFISLEGRRLPVDISNVNNSKISLVSGQKIKVSGTRNLVYKVN